MKLVENRIVLQQLAARSSDPALRSFLKKLAVKTKHILPETYEKLGLALPMALELTNIEGHLHKEDILAIWPEADKKIVGQILKTQ